MVDLRPDMRRSWDEDDVTVGRGERRKCGWVEVTESGGEEVCDKEWNRSVCALLMSLLLS